MLTVYVIIIGIILIIYCTCRGMVYQNFSPCPKGTYQARCINIETGGPVCVPYEKK